MPKIELREVTKTFESPIAHRSVVALKEINLSVDEGKFLTILGASGCGKSTLLEIVAGLQLPTSGEVFVNGIKVLEPDPKRNMVFQENAVFPWRTVLRNVELGLELQGQHAAQRRKTARKYLAMVKLEGFENFYPHQLSGGMKQRVGLARALATNPEILLMDEPFGAVDAIARMKLQDDLLAIWQQERKTVLFVTHDIHEAVYLGDRVAVMQPGPGQIIDVLPISLDRPRSRASESIAKLEEHILNLMSLPLKDDTTSK